RGMPGPHAAAPMNLHRDVDHTWSGPGRKQFGHGPLAGHTRGTHVFGPGRAIDQQRCRIDFERHIRHMSLNHLKISEWRAKQMAVGRTFQRLVQRAASEAKRGCTARRSKYVARCHRNLEPTTPPPDYLRATHTPPLPPKTRH